MRRIETLGVSIRLGIVAILLVGCAGDLTVPATPADTPVEITLLHMNVVYEITPVEGGRRGGLARMATIRQRLLAENPHTFTLLAGDLYHPPGEDQW